MRHTPNKITDAEVPGIRHRLEAQQTTRLQEADRYGVAPSTIAKIARYETFRHVGRLPANEEAKPTATALSEGEAADAQAILRRLVNRGVVVAPPPTADALVREIKEIPTNPMEE